MKIDERILSLYAPGRTSLREVAGAVGTNHHKVKRVLVKNGVEILKAKKRLSPSHREAISRATKGRTPWSKGKRMPKVALYRNMASHIRFDVSAEWLSEFEDVGKLKFLNRVITNREGRFTWTEKDYKRYLIKFYYDPQFNTIYSKWLLSGECKWLRPTIDHILPKARGGNNDLDNLQFLTWFENRAKCDMTQEEWEKVKSNISDYMA